MEKKEREKSNKGRKMKSTSRTENSNISDDSDNIEVKGKSNEEEIEDNEPVVAMQNCWKGLSPLTAEDVVNKWYGCIYLSKKGPNLFIGKATQRFLNDEDGLIMGLKIDCLEQKLGTTDCTSKQVRKSDVDNFPVQNIICGPLNVNPLMDIWNA